MKSTWFRSESKLLVRSITSLIRVDTVRGLVSLCGSVKHFLCSRSLLLQLWQQPFPHETPPQFDLCHHVFIASSVGSSCLKSAPFSGLILEFYCWLAFLKLPLFNLNFQSFVVWFKDCYFQGDIMFPQMCPPVSYTVLNVKLSLILIWFLIWSHGLACDWTFLHYFRLDVIVLPFIIHPSSIAYSLSRS